MYEVSDDSAKGLTFTTGSYIDAINKLNDLMKHFAEEYREYEKYLKNNILYCCYFSPKARSPASPSPGTMYLC